MREESARAFIWRWENMAQRCKLLGDMEGFHKAMDLAATVRELYLE